MKTLFRIDKQRLSYTGGIQVVVVRPLEIKEGITAVMGPNGAGKTIFAKIVEKGWNFRTNRFISETGVKPEIRYMEFNDIHSWVGNAVGHYQQRYESSMNDDVSTVAEILGEKAFSQRFRELSKKFRLEDCTGKKINFLSSGELRKLLIINVLLTSPDLLILDNPYIGLDTASRHELDDTLRHLPHSGTSVMLLLSDPGEAPAFTDHRIFCDSNEINVDFPIWQTESIPEPVTSHTCKESEPIQSGRLARPVLELTDCRVSYGSKTVLDKVNWTVLEGERWSLSGPNGSGKSTLLSLIFADNPKAYSSRIKLFGRQRGTGESIWDVKKDIGFVSPEMQLHFHGSGNVNTIVSNGLNDTVGLFVRPTSEQLDRGLDWLHRFGIGHLASRGYDSLSSGERQLVLVARSMIKEPALLILDEPMHALDPHNKALVTASIENLLRRHPEMALIMVTHNSDELPESITRHFRLSHAT